MVTSLHCLSFWVFECCNSSEDHRHRQDSRVQSETNCGAIQVQAIGIWANSWLSTQTLKRIHNINILRQLPHLAQEPPAPHLEAEVLQAPSAPPWSPLSSHPAPDSLHHSAVNAPLTTTSVHELRWKPVWSVLRPANRSHQPLKMPLLTHGKVASLSKEI